MRFLRLAALITLAVATVLFLVWLGGPYTKPVPPDQLEAIYRELRARQEGRGEVTVYPGASSLAICG